jgi:GxxExxY protein
MNENEISKVVVELCLKLHRMYGPGLFESVYEDIFCYELEKLSIPFERQKAVPVIHETRKMDIGFRADVIILSKVIVELKSTEDLKDKHFKQVLTYLRLTKLKLGMLVNFDVSLIKHGIHRIVNNL